MNSIEDRIRAATRAEASGLREVRPLRLSLETSPQRAARPRWRRWQGWLAPIAAAAAVIAVAVALTIVKDGQDAPAVPAVGHTSAPGVVPEYYATLYTPPTALPPCAIGSVNCDSGPPTMILVGNTLTGARLATITPPRGTTFYGLTGAADDRTFVVDSYSTVVATSGNCFARTFYLLQIAPGTATPYRLTELPIPHLTCVSAMALSGSGSELAVAHSTPNGKLVSLQIYSVASGQLLHSWSTDDLDAFAQGANVSFDQNTGLSWMDDDSELAFPTIGRTLTPVFSIDTSLRVIDVAAGGTDLMKDSRAIWSSADPSVDLEPPHCPAYGTVLATADGQTVVCAAVSAPVTLRIGAPTAKTVPWRRAWLEYSTAAPNTAPRALYASTVVASPKRGFAAGELWVSESGNTVIGYLSTGAASKPSFYGVITSRGLRPLPIPRGLTASGPNAIAW